MRKILVVLLVVWGVVSALMAQTPVRYGYCPEALVPEEGLAQGTGKNKFVAAMIGLDPVNDPVMQRLKGHQITGVRCYLREDYKQAGQKRSFAMLTQGTPDAEPIKKMYNFSKGWNEVYFDEPVVIGDEKLFVGFQVFEKAGSPYPLLTYGAASVPGGAWINLDRKGWKELEERGTFMIQALLDDGAVTALENCAYALVADHPLTLVPGELFDAKVYFKNISDQPIRSLQLNTLGAGDEAPHVQRVDFEPALAAYDGRMLSMKIRSGREVGTKEAVELRVAEVNGKVALPAMAGKTYLYVTEDAFLRIPLVEEFTSQLCPNCPFMMYYVEKAREAFGGPLLYVTHHTGYQRDAFTLKGEEDLLYLFDEGETYNPAIMYDRLFFPAESNIVLPSTGETSAQPYLDKFNAVSQRPAMAEVLVDVEKTEAQLSARVHGRINHEMVAAGDPLYLTAYLVEDGLTLDRYMQQGLDVEGAPEDLVSGFRHNGIVRHMFTKQMRGDELTVAQDATFSVALDPVAWKDSWNWDNCQVVAFVHKCNEKNLADNFVLNAGSNRYNHLITGIASVDSPVAHEVRIAVGADRVVRTDVPVAELQIYNLSGRRCRTGAALAPGGYVVRVVTLQGQVVARKLLVR